MKCVICKNGKTKRGKVTVTLERGAMTLVVKGVPARVCDNCGEEYLEEKVMTALELVVKNAAKSGVVVEVRDYAA
jgi:YgiT-type zinc finger domain-containing protein